MVPVETLEQDGETYHIHRLTVFVNGPEDAEKCPYCPEPVNSELMEDFHQKVQAAMVALHGGNEDWLEDQYGITDLSFSSDDLIREAHVEVGQYLSDDKPEIGDAITKFVDRFLGNFGKDDEPDIPPDAPKDPILWESGT